MHITMQQLLTVAVLLGVGGVANMAAVIFGTRNWLSWMAKPLNAHIFGITKTWRGVIVGTITAGIAYWGIYTAQWLPSSLRHWWVGGLVGFTTMAGDAAKSAIKRRMRYADGSPRYPSGSKWWLDRYDPAYGLLVVGLPLAGFDAAPTIELAVVAIISLGLAHTIVSWTGYWLHLKATPH
jgi:hypothetical protein